MRQILWGLFKKMIIADNCAEYANLIFNNSGDQSAGTLILGAVFFTFQIYGDFSGYSDIAIGTARLFGFKLRQNFAFPYFSRDIAEFWRRWHISLSSWFRDYVYIPLGGSKVGKWLQVRNVFIIFVVSGFWHGANWTYLCWGLMNAIWFLPLLLLGQNRKNLRTMEKEGLNFRSLVGILLTFSLVTLTWIMFRAESISHAISYYEGILTRPLSISSFLTQVNLLELLILAAFVLLLLLVEWVNRRSLHGLQVGRYRVLNWLFYLFIAISITLFQGQSNDFIYFQF